MEAHPLLNGMMKLTTYLSKVMLWGAQLEIACLLKLQDYTKNS